jgi:hypothetical protein
MIKQRQQNISERVGNITLPVLSVKRIQRLGEEPHRRTSERERSSKIQQKLTE